MTKYKPLILRVITNYTYEHYGFGTSMEEQSWIVTNSFYIAVFNRNNKYKLNMDTVKPVFAATSGQRPPC